MRRFSVQNYDFFTSPPNQSSTFLRERKELHFYLKVVLLLICLKKVQKVKEKVNCDNGNLSTKVWFI